MKPFKTGSRRQKVILYYTLTVVLPGMILGYMAYRGMRNDQALREKENRSRLEADSQAFFTEIDSSFVQYIEEQTAGTVRSRSGSVDPSLLVVFIKDSAGTVKLISHKLLYLPGEFLLAQPVPVGTATGPGAGSRLEFIDGRFLDALRFYTNKALLAVNPADKNLALVAAARLYKKLNQPDSSKSLYNQIRKDYSNCLLNGQIPLGLTASLEILRINKEHGEKEEMRINSRQFLELLLHPSCAYGENQFGLFYQAFKDLITDTGPVIDSLMKDIDIQRARTAYLIDILNGPGPEIAGSNFILNSHKKDLGGIPLNSDELAGMYLTWGETTGHQAGMVVDFEVYLKSRAEKLWLKTDPDSSINIKIEDKLGKLVFSKAGQEGEGYLSFAFPDKLPPFRLMLMENKPGFLASLLNAGSGIYLLIFILITLLMLLGLVFTIYTLNAELRLNKLKSEFISNVSHELKSPLTSIRMMTEMLQQNRVLTDERKSEYYQVMLEESEHLSHLIDNILDFSRMEDDRKKYNFTDLDLNELLRKFHESTRERLAETGFEFRFNLPDAVPVIQADRNALLQVFHNLVDNAMKFSGQSKTADINLMVRSDEIQVCVKDYGIGISDKDQGKIFDRFYRSDESQQLGIKGSGIGLTIVKKIVEAHHGHLTLESRPGEGSTFCVHLPINKNSEP
jgi:signal transduction histidine kinase